jgi:ATP-binding cassette subfamily F protein uup
VGGYADWVRERDKAAARADGPAAPAQAQARADSKAPKGRKLTSKEKQELEALPARIDALESEQAELGAKLADPVFYQRERSAAAAVHVRLDELERQHAVALARWEELEAARTRP